MLEKGIEIIQNDTNVLVGTGQVNEYGEDIPAINSGFINVDELNEISNPAYRNQWLSARMLASDCRNLLSDPDVILSKSATGRPYLKDLKFHISLSHNPRGTAVIFSKQPCGIDIELVRQKIVRLEKKFLGPSELERFGGDPINLTLLWSAKESLYKMLDTPGMIFNEELHTLQIDDQAIRMKILLKSGYQKDIDVFYRIFDKQVLTYTSLAYTI